MYVLFSKSHTDYHIVFGIESDVDTNIPEFRIESLTFVEEFGTLSPVLNVKFFDKTGHIIYYEPILPSYTFKLIFGRSTEEYFEHKFKISNIQYDSVGISDMKNVMVSIDLISHSWESIYKVQKSRSFSNKFFSDIIKQLVTEIGCDSYDIEPTLTRSDVIQPYWSNAKFIDWLSRMSFNRNNKGGYVFFIDRNNKLIFKTYSKMYSEDVFTKLYHSSNRNYSDDDKYTMPSIFNEYVPMMRFGGFGLQDISFDYERKEFKRDVISPNTYQSYPLSNFHMLANEHISSEMINYSGRDTTGAVSTNILVSSQNNTQRMSIGVRRNDIKLGDIIDIDIPVMVDNKTGDRNNHIYSGKWLVSKMIHKYESQTNRYGIIALLTRNGINLPETRGNDFLLKAK